MKICSVCGKKLPNRYAIAGSREVEGIEVYFCSLHWDEENGKPRKDGGKTRNQSSEKEFIEPHQEPLESETKSMKESESKRRFSKEQAQKIMDGSVTMMKKAKLGTTDLFKRILKLKSPEEVIQELENDLDSHRQKKEEVSQKSETLYREIVQRKKAFEAAPKARRRILEIELKAKLKEYKHVERTLEVLIENESRLTMVRSKIDEIAAYEMANIEESHLEKLVDDLEDKAEEADLLGDAFADLEKAGKRRDRSMDSDDFMNELEGFEDLGEENSAENEETAESFDLSDFDEFEDKEKPGSKELE